MKTTRIREKIKKFLGDRPRNTAEILEHINSTMRHGTTSQQLGNGSHPIALSGLKVLLSSSITKVTSLPALNH